MTTTEITDPRPGYAAALSWAQLLVRNVRADQFDDPTPCSEFDVRTLLAHLVATVDRATALGRGLDAAAQPMFAATPEDGDWAGAYDRAIAQLWSVWRDAGDADELLDRTVRAPFGAVPGRAAVLAYTSETLVHGWDLAIATGQDGEADPELAGRVLAAMPRFLPAEPRGGEVPFDAPTEPRDGAGPTERLANWCGRRSARPA